MSRHRRRRRHASTRGWGGPPPPPPQTSAPLPSSPPPQIERYFLGDADELQLGPLNLRNEAAAVSLLLAALGTEGAVALPLLERLAAYSRTLFPEFGGSEGGAHPAQPAPGSAAFQAWAAEQAITSSLYVADFGCSVRGCAAAHAVPPGDLVLSIPRRALICMDSVAETDAGRMLLAIPGSPLEPDTLLIVFALLDRHDDDSAWAPFWRSLPSRFYTGLSYPPHLTAALAGTAALLEIQRAQQHLRAQYDATRPVLDMLLAAYPQALRRDMLEWDAFLWACELFYSYAFDVEFPDGSAGPAPTSVAALLAGEERGAPDAPPSQTYLPPLACLLNHSPWPHVVRRTPRSRLPTLQDRGGAASPTCACVPAAAAGALRPTKPQHVLPRLSRVPTYRGGRAGVHLVRALPKPKAARLLW